MKAELHPYQTRAVEFIKEHPHSGCLIDMGLGKTLITLTAISDLMDDLEVSRTLVVAPKKVCETTWTSECSKWDHLRNMRVVRVMGTEKQRIDALNKKADIYVLGRDSFVWLVKHYKAKMPFDCIVLDELTSFKSPKSQRFKAFKLIRSQPDRIIGLTGTPAPNGYEDLWAQIYCLDGGERLGKYITHYRSSFFRLVTSKQGYIIKSDLLPGAKDRIDNKISDICIAMKGEDYLTLPKMNVIRYDVELPSSLRKKYTEFEREQVLGLNGTDITAASAATLMSKLSQFTSGCIYDEEHNAHEIHDEKLTALAEIVEQAKSPVLVFYQYKFDVPRIMEAMKKVVKEVRKYDGEKDLLDWNDGKIDVLLAHPASTAYGLNLQQGGHNIVWLSLTWALELYQQANARLYRQGQQHPVNVYELICPNTVDELVYKALQGKAREQDALMESVKHLMRKYK